MKAIITGGNGLLAKELVKWNTYKDIALLPRSHYELDITDINHIEENIDEEDIDTIIHCAAYTNPMADHTKNPIKSIDANILGTANISIVCIQQNMKMVYISTDYVYPGTDGDYCEFDPVLPINDYAWSKLGGECSARMVPNHLIIRSAHSPRPFRHEKAVLDCIKSGIYVDEAAKLILKMLHNGTTGIVNLGGPANTVYDFAKESRPDVQEILRSDIKETIPSDISMNLRKLYDSTI